MLKKTDSDLVKKESLDYFLGETYFNVNSLVFKVMQEYFNLENKNNIRDWKLIGLSNRYLNINGIVGDVALREPIKSMHVIFSGKCNLVQKQYDIILGGPIINIYIVYKTTPKSISSNFVFKNNLFGAIKVSNTQESDKKNGSILDMA